MTAIGHSALWAALLLCGSITLAIAQPANPPATNPPAASPPTHVDPKGCAPGERLQTEGSGAPQPKSNEPLSDKLARTDGVLCPPNVDPDIKAPTPPGGRMPVIPPPGSPGGNQNVQPK
jgi:hypothetical protein